MRVQQYGSGVWTLPFRLGAQGGAVALLLVLGLTLDIAGALHVYGLSWLMGQRLALAIGLFLALLAGCWLWVASVSPSQMPLGSIPLRQGAVLLMFTTWCATSYDSIWLLPAAPRPLLLWLFGAGGLFLLAWAVCQWNYWTLSGGVVLLGIAARVVGFRSLPITPTNGDMLPLVRGALGNLLTGSSPYQMYTMPWEVPLTYLPATWLAYLPPFVMGVDIRWTNIVAELNIGVALLWLGRALPSRAPFVGLGLLFWAWLFVQPSAIHWSLATTAPVFWALLAWTLVLVVTGRRWSALALGVCGAASPLTLVLIPFVALHWLRRYGWCQTLLLGAVAAAVVAAIVLPFLLWSPNQFLFGVWRWFNDNRLYPRIRWEIDNTWAVMPGFSGVFWRRGLEGLLKPIQLFLVAIVVGWFQRLGATASALPPALVAAYLLFTLFNPVLWPYLYSPALVAALVAISIDAAAERERKESTLWTRNGRSRIEK